MANSEQYQINKRNMAIFCLFVLIMGLLLLCFLFMLQQYRLKSKPHIFGATYMTMDNPYFEALDASIRELIESNGDILISRDPAQNQEKQNEQIMEMLDKGAELLFINPADWKLITPALNECKKRGIPIINVDTGVFELGLVDTVVLSDNYDAGVQIATDVISRFKTAKIGIINHNGINSTNQRIQGFLETLDKANFDYVIAFHRSSSATLESSMKVMLEQIEENFDIDIYVGGNDPTALGGLAAMQKKGVEKDVLVYGIDGSPAAKAMISSGKMEGSSAQFPIKMGALVSRMAYEMLNGKPVDSLVYVPVELITKENISNYDLFGWQ